MLTIGSLFAGIGGLELGLEWAGLGPVLWQVEVDPKCRAVLATHWPGAERYADIRETSGATLARVDLICGGFPCQDVSSAGRRAGLAGARSGLWHEFARIVAQRRPRWVVVENVASGADLWIDAVRGALGKLRYASLPIPLAASDVGAPHERRRVFIVAADSDGAQLRIEPGRSGGSSGARSTEPRDDGSSESLGDAVQHGRPRTEGRGVEGWSESTAGSWWASEPAVGRVVDGLPGGVAGRDRRAKLRALGNAVVPQCAEVVGHVIRQLLAEAP